MNAKWYFKRLGAMTPQEIGIRVKNRILQEYWQRRYYASNSSPRGRPVSDRDLWSAGSLAGLTRDPPQGASIPLLRAARRLLEGRWQTFDVTRDDIASSVDWHWDPKHQLHVPAHVYSYDLRIHGENLPFDTKYTWELSRHNHSTVLAMAYWVTREDHYAEAAATQIQSWCNANAFLQGVHWTSGVELGMRLTAFAWSYRLLGEWSGRSITFDENERFLDQVYQHQWLLSRSMSFGSSANNHLLTEATGLFVAACGMPWFEESAGWRKMAQDILEREFARQIYPSGMSRELASEYHRANLETFFVNALEGELSGAPFSAEFWDIGRRMIDCVADLADNEGHPPRQGDSDDGSNLLLDDPNYDCWHDLLNVGRAVFGGAPWWPNATEKSLRSWLFSKLFMRAGVVGRHESSGHHKSVAHDAGLAVLRSESYRVGEIYCAFDAGSLGYLSIAAHGHADALAIELRVNTQPVLVDPGTYSYTADPKWRRYFRSTSAHNTLELCDRSQSTPGGPFLWLRKADAFLISTSGLDEASEIASAEGEQDGYLAAAGTVHRRNVILDRLRDRLTVEDVVSPVVPVQCRLHYHLHPSIRCRLDGNRAVLEWPSNERTAQIDVLLPAALEWRLVRGSEQPIMGWYSPSYDRKIATTTLQGASVICGETALRTDFSIVGAYCANRTR